VRNHTGRKQPSRKQHRLPAWHQLAVLWRQRRICPLRIPVGPAHCWRQNAKESQHAECACDLDGVCENVWLDRREDSRRYDSQSKRSKISTIALQVERVCVQAFEPEEKSDLMHIIP